jgi:malonyl-CoA O-methyltransferase
MIIKERIKKSYDKYAAYYDSNTELQRHLADLLANALLSDGVKFSRVLDIGCGTGYMVLLLEKMDCLNFLIGCDISYGMLNCARNKLNILCRGTLPAVDKYLGRSGQHAPACFVQSDAQRLPFNASSFDLVVSNVVYQWVYDLKAAFIEARRILKPGGKFYFVIFNQNTLWQLQQICKEIGGLYTASSGFPAKDTISAALSLSGFEIDSIKTFNHEKYYKDLWDLLSVLKNTGSTSVENRNISGLGWRRILSRMNELYAAKFGNENGLPAAYEALLVKATNVKAQKGEE